MSFLFESAWLESWQLHERVFDTTTQKSINREVNASAEYYIETDTNNPRAHYSFIIDQKRKFEKRTQSKKGMSEEFGYTNALQTHIRDNYWSEDPEKSGYNKKPSYWCLDIETRSGVSYKNTPTPKNMKIKHKDSDDVLKLDQHQIQYKFYDGGQDGYEYFNEETNEWESLHTAKFMQRNTGFPSPDLANEEITMFQIFDKGLNALILLGTKEFKFYQEYVDRFNKQYTGKDSVKDIKFIQCDNEIQLIDKYLAIFKMRDPLAIYAWNGDGFDYPYMHNRFKKLGYHKNIMSNHGKVTYKEDEFQGQKTYQVKTNGNAYIDLMKVYKKFTFVPQPEYNLNYIAFAELGENKVDHSEYVRFDDFYSGNYTIPDNPTEIQKNSDIYKAACEGRIQDVKDLSYSEFCYYGLKDTYLLERIIRKHLFHDIMIDISSKMGVLILDSMGTVKPWGSFIANVCYSKNLIMPPKEEHDHPDIVGGYVRVPNVGKHKWVMASDVTSMYPLVGIVSANMSAETYVSKKDIPSEIRDVILKYYPDQNEEARFDIPEEVHEFIGSKLKELNLSLGINGAMFDNSKLGIIPELVLDIYLGRKADKGKKFKFEQKKILLSGILEDRKTV